MNRTLLLPTPSVPPPCTLLLACSATRWGNYDGHEERKPYTTSVCELLEKIAALGLSTPMTVVMENARSQRCRLVLEKATQLGLELLFLPPSSPNLNLIERLWCFVRKEGLYSHSSEHFPLFKQAITDCVAETTGRHHAALSRLLTLEFQTFESSGCGR